MLSKIHDWWRRPCGGRDVVALALPLVISTMSFTVMTFIDRMFLTWYSIDAVAAAMPAAMLQFTLISFPLGVATYVNTFVAQYEGAGRPRQIGPIVWQGIWIGLVAAAVAVAHDPSGPRSTFTMRATIRTSSSRRSTYYDVLIFGSGAIILAGTLSSFFTGRGATRVVMAVDSTAAAAERRAGLPWIFGHGGFPRGGIAGAGAATVCAEWFRVICYAAIMLRPRYRRYRLASGWRWNRRPDAAALDLRRAGRLAVAHRMRLVHALHHPGRRAGKDQPGRHDAGLQRQQRGLGADDGHGPGRLDDGRPATGGQSARHGRAGHLDGLCPGHDLHVHDVAVLRDRARLVPDGPRRRHGPRAVRAAAGVDRGPAAVRGRRTACSTP